MSEDTGPARLTQFEQALARDAKKKQIAEQERDELQAELMRLQIDRLKREANAAASAPSSGDLGGSKTIPKTTRKHRGPSRHSFTVAILNLLEKKPKLQLETVKKTFLGQVRRSIQSEKLSKAQGDALWEKWHRNALRAQSRDRSKK